jgi:hypothetical protein
MIELQKLFEVKYGTSLELNSLCIDNNGVNFVSRTAKNNGISAKVAPVQGIQPIPAGCITVALGGSVLESFVQSEPFYTGFHIFCLSPLKEMKMEHKLFYCMCIRANKYRYNYGRQANRTLKTLLVPDISEIPEWADSIYRKHNEAISASLTFQKKEAAEPLNTSEWKPFVLGNLFELKRGESIPKTKQSKGKFPLITSTNQNNGILTYIEKPEYCKAFNANSITVANNGSIGEAFYQYQQYLASNNVTILIAKEFKITHNIALFLCAVIRQEKFKFNYGRIWNLERMKNHTIKLPAKHEGGKWIPDWEFMENYIANNQYGKLLSLYH